MGDHPNVYFQPPENIQMQYPCVVYQRYNRSAEFADNEPYNVTLGYQVQVIDTDPDSPIPDQIGRLPMSRMERAFVANNLNHDVFILYY